MQLTDNNGFWKQEFFIWKADTDIVTIICAVKVEMIHYTSTLNDSSDDDDDSDNDDDDGHDDDEDEEEDDSVSNHT